MSHSLTEADIKAMRKAVAFRVRFPGNETAAMELLFSDDQPSRCYVIADNAASDSVAVFTRTFVNIEGSWQALAKLVRVGDELVFVARDNSNGYLKQARILRADWESPEDRQYHRDYTGLHKDECIVSILRKGKTFISELVIASTITPDNTARAIKG